MMPDGSVWRTCGVCGGQNLQWLGAEGGRTESIQLQDFLRQLYENKIG
jgi:hypothetical protein